MDTKNKRHKTPERKPKSGGMWIDGPFTWPGIITLCAIFWMIGATMGARFAVNKWQDQAIASDHAERDYNGQFQWKTHPFTWSDLNFADYPEK